MEKLHSKLPDVGTTIFTIMSQMAAKHNAINLSQGFPNFPIDQQLKDLVDHYIQSDQNQYAPMAGLMELRCAISIKIKRCYDCDIDPEQEITITNGATEAIFSTITALIHHGDEVIIMEPAYDSYIPAIIVNGGLPVPITMRAPDFKIDWDEVKSKITSKTRMIIINSPHNPTGSILENGDLKALEEIADTHNLLVLSDEVYQHLIYDNQEHQSVLRYPNLAKRSIVTMSFGKSFHATGWRLGYCIAPTSLTKEIRKVHQYNTFSICRPIQHALADYLKDANHYLDLPRFFQRKRDLFLSAITGSRFKPLNCKGTYFTLAYYDEISDTDDKSFASWMTQEHKVAVIPISVFYSNQLDQKIIRFCFAKTDEILFEAAARICNI